MDSGLWPSRTTFGTPSQIFAKPAKVCGEAEKKHGKAETKRGEAETKCGEAERKHGKAESKHGEAEMKRGKEETKRGEAERNCRRVVRISGVPVAFRRDHLGLSRGLRRLSRIGEFFRQQTNRHQTYA